MVEVCTPLLGGGVGGLTADRLKKKKKAQNVYVKNKKKMKSSSLLGRFIFYTMHVEVKENAQEQSIMVG